MTQFKTTTRIVVLLALTLTFAPGLSAQQVTRINPSHITLRGVSLSSLWTGMMVGDSNYVAITHDASRLPSDSMFWTAVQAPFAHATMLDAVAYAGDTSHAVIAGGNGSLAWTSTDGTTWNTVSLNTSATIRAVTWNKSTESPVLVGVGDGGLIIRSTDQGGSWKMIISPSSVQLNAITFGTATDAVAVGNDTTMLQSHDGGQTWFPLAFPYHFQTWYGGRFEDKMGTINFTGVAMHGADSVYVCFDSAMYPLLISKGTAIDTSQAFDQDLIWYLPMWFPDPAGSSANDTTFPNYTSVLYIGMPDVHFNDSIHTLETYTTAIGDFDIMGTESDSYFGGSSYYIIGDLDGNIESEILRIRASAFWKQDTNLVIMVVGENCSLSRHLATPSTIISFTRRFPAFPGRNTSIEFIAVNTLANGFGYNAGVNQHFQKTTDSGRTWTQIILPIVGTQNVDSNLDNVITLDSATAIVVGWNGMILRYDPTGFHFLPSGTSERLESVAFPSRDTGIIVGDFGTVLQSSDRGQTWQPVNNVPTAERLYSVAFANNNIGIATGDSATILRTTDEGLTWSNINNLLTGTTTSIRNVQGFPDGTFLAQAGNELLRSTDFGQNWISILPPNRSDTCGMGFYSPQVGMIAEQPTSTELVPDTAHLAYTTDAGSSWTPFAVPFWNEYRVIINWLSDHEALIYGDYGFIDDIVISTSGVSVTRMDNASTIQLFPNPSNGDVNVTYSTKTSGPVQIELWDETGKKLQTLFRGEETAGAHERALDIPQNLHGAFFIRLSADGATSSTKLGLQ